MRTLSIIDLSHHNTVSSLDGMKSMGVVGIIHKATEGTGYTDPQYASRRAQMTTAGFAWASYHFLQPGYADAQMAYYLSMAKPLSGERVVIDYEDKACTLADLQDAIAYLRAKAPQNPICVYGGSLLKEQIGNKRIDWLADTSLWLAQYTAADKPTWPQGTWPRYDVWQYTDGQVGGNPKKVPGIDHCDCNEFNGSAEECRAWFSGTSTPAIAKTAPAASPVAVIGILKQGSSGDSVRALQTALGITADGQFGPMTAKAVRSFQMDHGLRADGIVGPQTATALGLK